MCDRVLFVERANELRYVARLSTKGAQPQGNRVLTGRKVMCRRPETRRPTHGQDEAKVKFRGGPNRLMLKNHRMNCG